MTISVSNTSVPRAAAGEGQSLHASAVNMRGKLRLASTVACIVGVNVRINNVFLSALLDRVFSSVPSNSGSSAQGGPAFNNSIGTQRQHDNKRSRWSAPRVLTYRRMMQRQKTAASRSLSRCL